MPDKDLAYYLSLAYPVRVYPEPDNSGYTAEIPDLPGCITCADTLPELWEMVEDAKRTWLEGSLAEGLPIPEPSLPQLELAQSGKFTVRLPRSLHHKLVERARREGVTLNHLVSVTLAESVGHKRAA